MNRRKEEEKKEKRRNEDEGIVTPFGCNVDLGFDRF